MFCAIIAIIVEIIPRSPIWALFLIVISLIICAIFFYFMGTSKRLPRIKKGITYNYYGKTRSGNYALSINKTRAVLNGGPWLTSGISYAPSEQDAVYYGKDVDADERLKPGDQCVFNENKLIPY